MVVWNGEGHRKILQIMPRMSNRRGGRTTRTIEYDETPRGTIEIGSYRLTGTFRRRLLHIFGYQLL